MKTSKQLYICNECGHEHLKWNGKCADCGEWNTLEEVEFNSKTSQGSSKSRLLINALSEIDYKDEPRIDTGLDEINRVLGGGLVKGSLVLISGDPGIGKSTLLLQICEKLGNKCRVLYVSGEESQRQIKLRADRLKIKADKLFLASGTDCGDIIESVKKGGLNKPEVLIIDSIQTITTSLIPSSAGSIAQVRECTNAFVRLAKEEEIPVFIVGHVNKDGGIAGPKVLEHIVDCVLYFEGDKQMSYRILRAVKNRFGSTNEIGVFEMLDKGLAEVVNPSAMLLNGRPVGVSGISILCTMEGSRPILAEVQALVSKSGFGQPRRTANGFDYNRLCLILAVLEKRTGFIYGAFDVYINIIGGLKIDEPAADLAIVLALYSGLCDKPIPDNIAVFGEIGLGGEVRNVTHIHERIRECARMGFEKVIVPKAALKVLSQGDNCGLSIVGVSNLKQMFKAINI